MKKILRAQLDVRKTEGRERLMKNKLTKKELQEENLLETKKTK